MANLLLVDDDLITRNGLLNRIRWQDIGFCNVRAAETAEVALKICKTFKPDVLLSDIKLGAMSGIELCMKVREQYQDMQIILISAYSDKDYLKAGIELGVVEYIEKPTDPHTIEKAAEKALKRYHKFKETGINALLSTDSDYVKSQVLFSLIDDFVPKNIEAAKESGLLQTSDTAFRIAVLRMYESVSNKADSKQVLRQKLTEMCSAAVNEHIHHMAFKDKRNIVFLLSGIASNDDPCLDEICKAVYDLHSQGYKLFGSIGCAVADADDLYLSYRSALEELRFLFPLGYGHTVKPGIYQEYDLSEYADCFFEEFRHFVLRHQFDSLDRHLLKLWATLREYHVVHNSTLASLFYKMDRCILKQHKLLANRQKDDTEADEDQVLADLYQMETIDEVIGYFRERITQWKTQLNAPNSVVVQQVFKIIHMEYNNPDLNIEGLAASIYLSPAYLSTLFKQNTGYTIGQYISQTRIEQAKRLLCENNYRFLDVAEKVGYKDANYFTKVFKRLTGVTPSEYRYGSNV